MRKNIWIIFLIPAKSSSRQVMIVIIYLLYSTEEPLISASEYPEAPGLTFTPGQSNLHQLPSHGLSWPVTEGLTLSYLLSGDQTTRNVMTV